MGEMRGGAHGGPPRVRLSEVLGSWAGGFLGIAAVAWVNQLSADRCYPELWL